jgi:hypothetical protein
MKWKERKQKFAELTEDDLLFEEDKKMKCGDYNKN